MKQIIKNILSIISIPLITYFSLLGGIFLFTLIGYIFMGIRFIPYPAKILPLALLTFIFILPAILIPIQFTVNKFFKNKLKTRSRILNIAFWVNPFVILGILLTIWPIIEGQFSDYKLFVIGYIKSFIELFSSNPL